jgi:hypothetical protein
MSGESRPTLIEVWNDVEYAAGGTRRSVSSVAWQGVEERSVEPNQPARLQFRAPRSDAACGCLDRDRALRLERAGEVLWYRIADVIDIDGPQSAVTEVTADPILLDLGARGEIRDGAVRSFTVTRATVAQILADYVFTNLAEDGLSYWTLGTVEPTAVLEEVSWSSWTRLELVRFLEQQTGATARVRDTGTGFALDLLDAPGADADRIVLRVGSNVAQMRRTRRSIDRTTVVRPVGIVPEGGTQPASVSEVAFEITGIASNVVTLADPETGEAMIANDLDLTGAHLLAVDGTLVEITATDADASTVTVASTAALSVNDIVGIRADASGNLLERMSSGVTPPRARVITLSSARGERNYATNPLFADWSAVNVPAGWTEEPATYRVGEYRRDEPAMPAAGTVDGITVLGNFPSGNPGFTMQGFAPGARLYAGDQVAVLTNPGSTTVTVVSVVAVANGAGEITPVTTALGAAITNGEQVIVNTGRPSGFPDEAFTNPVAKLMDGNVPGTPTGSEQRLQSAPVTLPYLAGDSAQVNVAAAFTMARRSSGGTPRDPLVFLRNQGTGGVLAWAKATFPTANETVHETVTANATLTGATEVTVCLSNGLASDRLFTACRWVMLWLGTSDQPPETPFSMANQLWHAGKRALGVNAASYAVDLADVDPASIVLGGPAQLISDRLGIDQTSRIVGVRWNLADPRRSQVIVDRPLSPLTRLIR